ncbi:MAG: hypothetical protein AB1758_21475 [Candidatus Eremiobacterota bacterium]
MPHRHRLLNLGLIVFLGCLLVLTGRAPRMSGPFHDLRVDGVALGFTREEVGRLGPADRPGWESRPDGTLVRCSPGGRVIAVEGRRLSDGDRGLHPADLGEPDRVEGAARHYEALRLTVTIRPGRPPLFRLGND